MVTARRILHRLNDGVEQHTIEARVLKADALLVVLDEPVHGGPPHDRCRTTPIVGGPPFLCATRTRGFQGAEVAPG
jgi:hypothetical protein